MKGLIAVLLVVAAVTARSQTAGEPAPSHSVVFASPDSSRDSSTSDAPASKDLLNAWGIDILISNGGFGLGGFYRREFNDEWFGFTTISVSESKDDREVEEFDVYTNTSYVPGKLNRFLVIPLTFGVQHRMFKDDITDNFRPYINAGAGPTLIYVTPFTNIIQTPSGPIFEQVEFFKALGRGHSHYTVGGFIGFGANFGTEKSNLFGVNFRYYFTYLFGAGIPSLYNLSNGDVAATKKDFGGFYITLNVGMAY